MSGPDRAQIYLIAPPALSLATFGDVIAGALDAVEIACVRLALATSSEDEVMRAADLLRAVCHARDVPLVVAEHVKLAARLGLDGVHLGDGPRRVRAAREALGANAIVGAFAHASRHEGITAAEIGADYVSFGPLADTGLGDGAAAPFELFEWWSEMIETPVVAEGALTLDRAGTFGAVADFVALGDEVWSHPDGAAFALREYAARITLTGRVNAG